MKIDTDNNLIIPGSLEISDLKAIKVVGELNKVEDFLQGQLTSDISLLNNGASQLSCICDHKGQVMADFVVLKQDNEFFIIIQKDFITIFTGELEIFAKFGSVSFDVCDHKIIGEIYNKGDSDNFYYSNDEFELSLFLKKSNYKNKNSINLDMWNAANKILGILHLDKSDSGKFRPLEINFDKQRVSFEKGCFRGQEIVARMKYLGIERIKTKFGLIECLKLKPFMEAGRVFRSNEGIDLWVTNDENRIPVKVKANLRVGTIVADLTSFRGIANPFKIIVDD